MKKSIRRSILDAGNLADACRNSYAGKSARKREKHEVKAVMSDLDGFSSSTVTTIRNDDYHVGRYRHLTIHDKKKTRELSFLPFSDICVQNHYKRAIEPVIIRQTTDDMCAGLPHRGVTARCARWNVVRKVRKLMRSARSVYVWQGDISKFYDSVRNVVVMKLLERKIHDPFVLKLLREHIMNLRTLAIGDPMSHLIASLVIAPLVRHLKSIGARLVNYADDFLVFAETREECRRIEQEARRFAVTELRLHFKPSQIRRVDAAPIRFCGFVFHPNGKVALLSYTKKRYVRTRHSRRSRASYNGMILACNGRNLRKKVEVYDNFAKKH